MQRMPHFVNSSEYFCSISVLHTYEHEVKSCESRHDTTRHGLTFDTHTATARAQDGDGQATRVDARDAIIIDSILFVRLIHEGGTVTATITVTSH